jgi:hypothetical protein
MPIGALVPLIAAGVTAIGGMLSARKQAKENKKLAEYQNDANQKMLEKQLEYDKPKNQMARFQDAGLNPNLIYGQGTPGNQSTPLKYPDIKPTDYSRLMEAVPVFNQTRLTDSQVQAQNAATRQKYAMTELNRLQARVLEKNPLLDDAGFKAIIDGLKASAEIKASDSKIRQSESFVQDASAGWQVSKIANEVKLLEQKFNLGTADSALKAATLKSKEFQNAILEVQKKFMADGDIGPGQILQFIQSLLLKAL